jgi:hypothetical protein
MLSDGIDLENNVQEFSSSTNINFPESCLVLIEFIQIIALFEDLFIWRKNCIPIEHSHQSYISYH